MHRITERYTLDLLREYLEAIMWIQRLELDKRIERGCTRSMTWLSHARTWDDADTNADQPIGRRHVDSTMQAVQSQAATWSALTEREGEPLE